MAKAYDRAYFDRWYREAGFGDPARMQRKLAYAMGAAEYLLDRPVRSVLDVGCGEGDAAVAVRRRWPEARYVGVDPSEYVIDRFGRRRGLVRGSFGSLGDLDLGGPFDLVVCCDVLPYVGDREVRRGLPALGALAGGVAFLEVWTSTAGIEGDLDGFHPRRPSTYERWFASAGLHRVGPHLYVSWPVLDGLAPLERPTGPAGA